MEQGAAVNNKKTIIQAVALIAAVPDPYIQAAEPFKHDLYGICILYYVISGGLSYKFIGTVLAIAIPTAALF